MSPLKATNIKYLSLLVILLLCSCSKREYVELPSMLEMELPSQDRDMQFNISLEKKQLPNKIRRIYQVQDQDTMNILEFDKNKNLIFKYYKQFEGDYWHDKFLFMIEANVYKDNKLVKTYYLHSNVGYELFLYGYDGENIDNIEEYHLDNIKGVNINQYSFIQKIRDYKNCVDFADKLEIKANGKLDYEGHRDFSDTEVKEYYADASSYKLFRLNEKNRIEKIEYYAKGKKWENDSKFYRYDQSGRVAMTYSMKGKDTLKYTRYKYDGQVTTITKREVGVATSTKMYVKNNLSWDYISEENSIRQSDLHTLDRYGLPVRIIVSNGDKTVVHNFKNYYEFYK
jgi:hypothetical protein